MVLCQDQPEGRSTLKLRQQGRLSPKVAFEGLTMPAMPRDRTAVAALVSLLVLGSLAATGGYAWYLHSDFYRLRCAAALSRALGLPALIGRVVPRSFSAKEFREIRVYLPGRRGRVLSCERAVVAASPDDPQAYAIDAVGGTCEISTRTWLREDYRRVVESGLRPGFAPGGPRLVRFEGFTLLFERPPFALRLGSAAGTISFASSETGTANLIARQLNGDPVREPIALTARFSPLQGGLRIERVELRLPQLPVEALRLGDLIGGTLTHGQFAGELRYSETPAGIEVVAEGTCEGLDLAELTTPWLAEPAAGRLLRIELHELRIRDGHVVRVRFGGQVADAALEKLLAPLELGPIAGTLALDVGQADLTPGGIAKLSASGTCRRVNLEPLARALGLGGIAGLADVRLEDLQVRDNRLVAAEAVLRVRDDSPQRWIEASLVSRLMSRWLKLPVPDRLAGRIEYTQLGLRLHVEDERLWISGLFGENERTILTAQLAGQPVELIRQPEGPIDLGPWLDSLRRRAGVSAPAASSPVPPTRP